MSASDRGIDLRENVNERQRRHRFEFADAEMSGYRRDRSGAR
jgi:hypothetical protein